MVINILTSNENYDKIQTYQILIILKILFKHNYNYVMWIIKQKYKIKNTFRGDKIK